MHIKTTFFFSFLVFAFQMNCNNSTNYYCNNEKTNEQANNYSKTQESSCRYLAMRDVPLLINKYSKGPKTLDYGCGTGLSIELLQKLGLDVTGVDVSLEMIQQAAMQCPGTPLYLIKNGRVPYGSNTFDLVFSSLVLFEIGTEKEMIAYLKEAKRLLKKEGVFIAVTGSQHVHSHNWLGIGIDFPENKNLKSGDLAKSYIPEANMVFFDYFWTESDYRSFFNMAGFSVLEVNYPLGKDSDPFSWKDEKIYSPYVIFVLQ